MKILTLLLFAFIGYHFGRNYGIIINRSLKYGYCKIKRFMQGRYHPNNIKTN